MIKKKIKINGILEGDSIYLRDIRLTDVNKNYCKWMNDLEVIQFLESRFEKWTIKKLKNYVNKFKNNPDYLFSAIIFKKDNRYIGNIKLGPINRIHKFADIGIMIGERSFWGKGFATEAIKLMVDYAFNKLNLHKLTAGAYSNNPGSIMAFEKAGFSVEGIRKKHCFYNGDYVDAVLVGIVRE